jgi:putative ABC transport system ATP-binding protein
MTSPALILADEPTGNLDQRVGKEIVALFERLNREGVTLVVVTHERSLAELARRQIEIVDGSIVRDSALSGAYR